MPLLQFVFILVAVGVLLYVVNHHVPMDGKVKKILNVVVIVALIFWVANLFGLFGPLSHIRIG